MNKKGFTLIELLAVIMILGILVGIAVMSVTGNIKRSKDKAFNIQKDNFEDAVLQAYTQCMITPDSLAIKNFCDNHALPEIGESSEQIKLSELVNNSFIDKLKYSGEECDENNSYVVVTRKPVYIKDTNIVDNYSIDFEYKTCLICSEKRSDGCN